MSNTTMVPYELELEDEERIRYFPGDYVVDHYQTTGYGSIVNDKFVYPSDHLVRTFESVWRTLEVIRSLVLTCSADPEWKDIAHHQQLIDTHFGR